MQPLITYSIGEFLVSKLAIIDIGASQLICFMQKVFCKYDK